MGNGVAPIVIDDKKRAYILARALVVLETVGRIMIAVERRNRHWHPGPKSGELLADKENTQVSYWQVGKHSGSG
jgi:hypothetical protein